MKGQNKINYKKQLIKTKLRDNDCNREDISERNEKLKNNYNFKEF